MHLPFAFVENKFTDNGAIIPDPTTWATMKVPTAADAGFSALVEPVSNEEFMSEGSKVY